MLKRLLALFSKKPSSQKTFEEKLERLKGESLADEIRRDDESLRRALHPGHTPSAKPQLPPDSSFDRTAVLDAHGNLRYAKDAARQKPVKQYAPPAKRHMQKTRRGMTVNQASSSRAQTDDMMLAMMMQQTIINTPSALDDTCRITPSHGGYDTSPSDGGSSNDGGGGGSCD